jgi:hypothetical protein
VIESRSCEIEKNKHTKAVPAEMLTNELYLAVLPLIHMGGEFGKTEQVITLFPDAAFATKFFPDEVEGYIATFKNRISLLSGGHVEGYSIQKIGTDDGRVIVQVTQNVS